MVMKAFKLSCCLVVDSRPPVCQDQLLCVSLSDHNVCYRVWVLRNWCVFFSCKCLIDQRIYWLVRKIIGRLNSEDFFFANCLVWFFFCCCEKKNLNFVISCVCIVEIMSTLPTVYCRRCESLFCGRPCTVWLNRPKRKPDCPHVGKTFTSLIVCLGLLISHGATLTVLTLHVALISPVILLFFLFFTSALKCHQQKMNFLSCWLLFCWVSPVK